MQVNRIWHLTARKFTGDATLEELQELEQYLLADPELAAGVEVHLTYFERGADFAVSNADRQAWKKQLLRLQKDFPEDFPASSPATTQTNNNVSEKKIRNWWYTLAGLAFALLSSVLTWYGYNKSAAEKDFVVIKNDKMGEENALHKRVILPDGSLVWLNKNSHILYNKDFGVDNREITLSGEAFFDVAHRAELPMLIHAGPVNIRVKGTAFNVSAYDYDNKIETSLIRGAVELSVKGSQTKKIIMKPNEKVIVTLDSLKQNPSPGKISYINLTVDKLIPESKSGLIPEVAWMENKLVFSNMPFLEVKEKLERWYDIKINLENRNMEQERFTGVVSSESLDTFLKALQMTYNFRYTINKDTVTIY